MRVLIFGGTGMLGHKLLARWSAEFDVFATIRGRLGTVSPGLIPDASRIVEGVDIENADLVLEAIDRIRPDVVFNAVGIIKQLPDSKNTIQALTVNSIFPHRLAEIAGPRGIRVITVSTDCVFAGDRGMYTEADFPDARDLYGISKRLGELDAPHLTLRTSIIGPETGTAHSLLEWFLSNAGGRVKGYRRAIYSGFPTVVFADIVAGIIRDRPDLAGLYHVSSEPINKFDLLCLIRDAYGADIGIDPDDEFVIDRSLGSERFRKETGFRPEPWESMVKTMADDDAMHGQKRRFGK